MTKWDLSQYARLVQHAKANYSNAIFHIKHAKKENHTLRNVITFRNWPFDSLLSSYPCLSFPPLSPTLIVIVATLS